jgi:Uma2 family endonuclease
MGSDAPFELIQGELARLSPSTPKSNLVLGNIYSELRQFVRSRKLGYVFVAEAGFRVESNPDTVVAPDVAFVALDRMPTPIPERGFPPVIPDLIVEVISPTDEPGDIKRKQAIYERVGVPLVWWIDPAKEAAKVYSLGMAPREFDRSAILDGGSALPGFTLALTEAFAES